MAVSGTEAFLAWFQETFGAPCPIDVRHIAFLQSPDETHWTTEPRAELSSSALMLPVFVDALDSYVVAGAWGYGMNSHAFYWTERHGPHRCFFRLPFGGVYGSAEEAREVVRFLEGYRDWLVGTRGALTSSTLVHSMGTPSFAFRVALPDGAFVDVAVGDIDVPRMPNGATLPAREWWAWLRGKLLLVSSEAWRTTTI